MRTTLGIKVSGADPDGIPAIAGQIERALSQRKDLSSVYAERPSEGRYLAVDVDRFEAARQGVSIEDIHSVIAYAVGGQTITQSVEGRARFPILIRYPQEWRDSLEHLRALPIIVAGGGQVDLGQVAKITYAKGPALIRSEDARPVGWIFVEADVADVSSFIKSASKQIEGAVAMPEGYSWRWSGRYEYLARAKAKLARIAPLVLAVSIGLLFLVFRRFGDVALVLGALPFAFIGAMWFLWLLDYRWSVATAVGFIALAGLALETGMIMLLFLNNAWKATRERVAVATRVELIDAITEGALLRLRPKLMTAVCIFAGLLPIMFGYAAGSDVMRRIAAPMIGGMVTATILTLLVIPSLFLLAHLRDLPREVVGAEEGK
jgi:Cu(I)/Ag(I) efflux system membrane protein CusA/SilA